MASFLFFYRAARPAGVECRLDNRQANQALRATARRCGGDSVMRRLNTW